VGKNVWWKVQLSTTAKRGKDVRKTPQEQSDQRPNKKQHKSKSLGQKGTKSALKEEGKGLTSRKNTAPYTEKNQTNQSQNTKNKKKNNNNEKLLPKKYIFGYIEREDKGRVGLWSIGRRGMLDVGRMGGFCPCGVSSCPGQSRWTKVRKGHF